MKKETATEWVCRNGKCVRGKAAKRTTPQPPAATAPLAQGSQHKEGD